jgi:ActR/RegA family two-component response regulator
MGHDSTVILLVGADDALLEGLSQSFAALGYAPNVVPGLGDARQAAASQAPLIAVVDDVLAAESSADVMGIALAPGGALVLYHGMNSGVCASQAPGVTRAALANLAMPLERHRLFTLVQHVETRARATGRQSRPAGRRELEA